MIATKEQLLAWWSELAGDPAAPGRFEMTEHGEVVLQPRPSGRHQTILAAVAAELEAWPGGIVLHRAAVLTTCAGIRKPDLAWLPTKRIGETLAQGPLETAPPLVVEVLSAADREPAVAHRIRAFLESGAEEVAVVSPQGAVAFHRADGVHVWSRFGISLSCASWPLAGREPGEDASRDGQ